MFIVTPHPYSFFLLMSVPIINFNPQAVTQTQAYIRGWNVRRKWYWRDQILPFVQKYILEFSSADNSKIAHQICVGLNGLPKQPRKWLFVFSQYETAHSIARPVTIMLKRSQRSFQVILRYDPSFNRLGIRIDEGAYQTIFRAHEFIFSRHEAGKLISHDYKVIILSQKDDAELTLYYHNKFVEKCIKNITECPIKISCNSNTWIMMRSWFNSTLAHAASQRSLPLDFSSKPRFVPFSIREALKALLSICKSLECLHEEGYVHRDVKPKNILIKFNNNKITCKLNDFNLSQKIGRLEYEENYRYWDCFSRFGIVTPSTDTYGLVLSLAESLMPKIVNESMSNSPRILSDFDSLHQQLLILHANHYLKLPHSHYTRKDLELEMRKCSNYKEILIEFEVLSETLSFLHDVIKKHQKISDSLTKDLLARFNCKPAIIEKLYFSEILPQFISVNDVRDKIEILLAKYN